MIFTATINQTVFLFSLIIIGFVLMRFRLLPESTDIALSKLENYLFLPALLLGSMMDSFRADMLSQALRLICAGFVMWLITLPFALLLARLLSRDSHTRGVITYDLVFSNFGYMGNAMVGAMFPSYLPNYLIFCLPIQLLAYGWGVPVLLIGDSEKGKGFGHRLKKFANPTLIGLLLGILIGYFQLPVPDFFRSLVTTAGNCMSPVAMLLTGIIAARISLRTCAKDMRVYLLCALRLLIIPLAAMAILLPLRSLLDTASVICIVAFLSMPLGMNPVIIPGAYGKDTKFATALALVSHALGCITIPLIFLLLEKMV